MTVARRRIVGSSLIAVTLLIALIAQLTGQGLVWLDPHPLTPKEIAAKGGQLVGSAVHVSFSVVPLIIMLFAGLLCLIRDQPVHNSID